jgi:hypothetical protein
MRDVTMSQISPPLRILLIGSVVFLSAWFVFMRPGGGSDVTPTATAPATTGTTGAVSAPGKAVQAANGAAAAQTAANAAHGDNTQSGGAVAPSTSAGKAATPGKAGSAAEKGDVSSVGLPASVAKAVASKKVLVMLFWNPKAADDRAVRKELRQVGRHKGAVTMHVANVNDIARYAPITRGVDVEQSPSVVVVGRDLSATLLAGYSDSGAINQAVSDALRAR